MEENKRIISASRLIVFAFALVNLFVENTIIRGLSLMIIVVVSMFMGSFIVSEEYNNNNEEGETNV